MKKWMIALLAVLLAVFMPASAMAAQGDVVVPCGVGNQVEDNVNSFCVVGNTLYMVPYEAGTLYAHTVGEAEPKAYTMEVEETSYQQSRNCMLLSDGERLLMLEILYNYGDDQQTAEAALYELALDSGAVERKLLLEPDWGFMRESNGQYYRYPQWLLALKDCMMIGTYDDNGNRLIFKMSYADGSVVQVEIPNMVGMTRYTQDRVLIEQYDYNQREKVKFVLYDPATDAVESLSEVAVEEYQIFDGLACDVKSGEVYFVRGGEVHALDVLTGEIGEAIASMPLDVYDNGAQVTENGYYAYATYGAYVMRNLHPETSASATLKIMDNSYAQSVNTAYYRFVNEHSDASVVLSRDGSSDLLIDNMMNRDSSVDVYIMSAQDSNYEAVFNRGFVVGFEQSEVLSALAEKMNPSLLEQLSSDGEFSVLPVQAYFWLPRVSEKALEKLDVTLEELPTNWSDFVDFLLEVQDRWPQDGSLTLMDPWTSIQSARMQLFDQIFEAYQTALSQDPHSVDSRTMTEILQKLEKLDFSRFGQPDESVFEDENYNPVYDEDRILLTTNTGTTLSGLTMSNTPMVMALAADLPVCAPVELSVAFINPYSENIDLALEFVEALYQNMDKETLYLMLPEEAEPTLNPWYEENLKYAEKYVAEVEKELAEAEEADRQMLEEQLESAKRGLEWSRNSMYSIREEDIAWLKAHADNLVVQGSNWLYGDDGGDARELIQQYSEGRIDANRLMKEIDGKIRMMLMEGY